MAGLYFEDFEPGNVYRHEVTRTVTLADSIQFACLCMETEPTYIDEDWAKRNGRHGRIEVYPYYALAIVMAVQVTELTQGTTLGNLAMGGITFPHPVFPGDSLRGQTTILGKTVSKSKADRGVVEFFHEGFNQEGKLIASCMRKGMMLRRHPRV
ncbi:MaoC family dehydratase [Sphingobium herbicidovorans NBRC 16415]|uniref:MaoC family dehydratase n=1 Tax=Sphingobium herbicidovorans (strain ATCC 700291 / DSM 11019 / CCUG 56400 / KCTC 2939 / LMG 18315 / NBRC 16415 / MH) TaxID=1219045 RepID=A0A086PC29_SPHHM|nr:MaoC family dehydratase [Sphingobium herbicidovorans]KFG90947.1 MaoC family dehydratase [Sphingobium herbicidovorans NBRC 16415]